MMIIESIQGQVGANTDKLSTKYMC